MLTSKRACAPGSEEPRKLQSEANAVVQPCAFLILKTRARNKNCVSCAAGRCDRITAIGLDLKGRPLPTHQRPRCGAKTRQGGKCSKPVLPGKKRCKLHGGLSTGPKSHTGKQRIRDAQYLRWSRVKGVDKTSEPKRDIKSEPPQPDAQLNEQSPVTRRKRWRRTRRISPWAL